MAENFTSATTQIQSLLETQTQIYRKAAGLLVQAIQDRMKKGKVTNAMVNDINNAMHGFSYEEKCQILAYAITQLAMGGGNTVSSNAGGFTTFGTKGSGRSSVFDD